MFSIADAASNFCMQCSRIGQFKGDEDGLVDVLIKACEQKGSVNVAGSPSFGRDLVPWSDDTAQEMVLEPLESSGRRVGSIFPTATKPVARANIAHKASANKRFKAPSPPRSGSPSARQLAVPKPTAGTSFACPALASAPKPSDLPMPTSGFMSRAIVRSRSQSPSKDAAVASFFAPGQVHKLIPAVAA